MYVMSAGWGKEEQDHDDRKREDPRLTQDPPVRNGNLHAAGKRTNTALRSRKL